MRKAQKKQIEDILALLEQAHNEIKRQVESKNFDEAMELLGQCQDSAVQVGELIEKTEGENTPTVVRLEEYCETLYEVHEELSSDTAIAVSKLYKRLRKSLIQVENSVKNDIKIRLEMVFMPYKASMWDSLESVWMAADADPDCDAYVVPIPYYDKNKDGSFGAFHYEGDRLPDYVPVVHYDDYLVKERCPDAVFIHNPYDQFNHVTSIDPRFYSYELKKSTECLVYIPYYTTSGGMNEGQSSCSAYYFADYIITQTEKYGKFFDPELPQEKFVPLGSPKFDKVMRLCNNPAEPPKEWKEKTEGKKVYFYNTSLNGMLADTEAFLNKMAYVFRIFKGRRDVCLLWRPHPLMESTFDSMREAYRPYYDALKRAYVEEDIGILDETTDIEKTIALSDVYIGDAGTSVISLFGIVGKPIFILNNKIHSKPEKDDWRGEKLNFMFDMQGNDRYYITRNDQLWFSEKNDYHYRFFMDLNTQYSSGGLYMGAVEIQDKIYIVPRNAQHMLVIKDKKITKIKFKPCTVQAGAFSGYWYNEKYIFLFPNRYSDLVRFQTETQEISYIDGVKKLNVRNVGGEWRFGGRCFYGNELVFASPEDNRFIFMDIDTLEKRELSSNSICNIGTQGMVVNGDELWLMPLNGMTITRWNPKTGEVREYGNLPQGFKAVNLTYGYECNERPFGGIAFSAKDDGKSIIVSPCWGNMYLLLNKETGEMKEWETPIPFRYQGKNDYFPIGSMGGFVSVQQKNAEYKIWYAPERRLFKMNIDTREYQEMEIVFDYEELKEHEAGFMETSENLQYSLCENAFNSLENLLDGQITGKLFNREKQLSAFSKINANLEGTCGEKVFHFVAEQLGAAKGDNI